MTDSPKSFEYSGEQWTAIVGTTPANKAANADLMLTVRQQLETAASDYHALSHHHRRRFARGSPAKPWKRRRDLIDKALVGVEPTSTTAYYVDHLREARRIADTHCVAYDMLGKGHKGTLDPARDRLYERVLSIWTNALGGKLTTGSTRRKNDRRVATSAAIRFFEAAVGPITARGRGRPIKRDAIAKVVIAERKQRKKTAERKAEMVARTRNTVISKPKKN